MSSTLRPSRRRALLSSLLLGSALLGGPLHANTTWPQRPITFVVPFAAGTATDVMARILAEPISQSLGVPIVIDNKPGAGASIGASAVARAAPDGYTVLMGSSTTHAANAALFRKLSYDPIVDFEPVTRLGYVPQVMLVQASSPIQSVDEFMQYAKANKGKVNYAQGSSGNLLPAAILNSRQELGLLMVPYKSPPQALQDLLGGQVQMMFSDLSVALAHIKAGKLRPLAVTAATEHPLLPQVPPLAKTIDGFELTTWMAMFVPAKTPKEVVEKLRQATLGALNNRSVAAKIHESGMRIQPTTSSELGAYVASETVKWAKYVMEAGVEPQ